MKWFYLGVALIPFFALTTSPQSASAAPVAGAPVVSCNCQCGDGTGNDCQQKGTGAPTACTHTGLPPCPGGGCGCYDNSYGVNGGDLSNGPMCSKGPPPGVTHVPNGPGEVDRVSCSGSPNPVTVPVRTVPQP